MLIIADRTDSTTQIEKVFLGVREDIYHTSRRGPRPDRNFIGTMPWLV